LKCEKPAGAFYCWVKIDGDSMDFCSKLLEQSKVAIIPGEPFGMKDCVRLSYAVPKEKIKEAIKRIKEFLA
jgi:aspartate aminotransferase